MSMGGLVVMREDELDDEGSDGGKMLLFNDLPVLQVDSEK
jgi:hypothetical protein